MQKKIEKNQRTRGADWTFETLKARLENQFPIVENEDGTFTVFVEGGNDVILGKREDFDIK